MATTCDYERLWGTLTFRVNRLTLRPMKKLLYLLLSSAVITACVKDKKTTWETDMLAPIVKSELTVSDLLKSDDIVENPDSTLKLVYSSDLFSMNTDSFVELPDSSFTNGASLQSLELPSDTIEYRITMGEIARSVGGFMGPFILANHGATINNLFGETDNAVAGQTIDISMSDLFDELILDSGIAKVILINETPFLIQGVDFELNNKGGSNIITHSFPAIPTKTQVSEEFVLKDDTINSELEGVLDDITVTIPAGMIAIDTNEAVVAQIVVRDLKPREATAVWPDQNVIEETQEIPFEDVDVDFKDAQIRDGEIYFKIFSSLEDSIYLTYEVSNVIDPITGDPFKIDTVIKPAPANGFSTMEKVFPLDGYHFDFNGDGYLTPGDDALALLDDTINSYVTHLTAKIQYTGLKKTLSLDDTVFVQAEVRELKPMFARGFLNNKIVTAGPSAVNFDLFNKVKSGQIDLEDVEFEIEVDNGMGASAEARFNRISGINANNNQVDLTFTPGHELMSVTSAGYNGENQRTTHTTSSKTLTPSNSNIDVFVENLPSRIEYELEVELNAGVTKPADWATYGPMILSPDNPMNFIHHEDEIHASLNMEVPLSVIADSLVLVDTLDFDLKTETGNEVESGKFKLLVDNGFPLDATTSLYFLDDTELVIDSLWSNETVVRGNIDGNGRVTSRERTVIEFEIPEEKMDIIKSASKIYVVAGFHTFDLSDAQKAFYKIYSDYSFGVKLVGDFKYQFSN